MPYEIPNWIKPPDSIAKSFAQGLGIAADIQNQRASLQQRYDEDAQRSQLERQRLAQEQQYNQQRLGISEQELMQSQQLNQLKIQDAQRRFAAQQQYQQDLASGVDPLQAIMKNFPGTDESMTGYGQLARQMQLQKYMQQPAKPITFKDPVSGKDVSYLQSYTAEGQPHYQRMIEPTDTMTKSMMLGQANYLREQLRQLRAAQIKATSDPLYQTALTRPESERNDVTKAAIKEVEDRQKEITDLENELQGIYSEYGAPRVRTTAPPGGGGGGGGGVQYEYDSTQKRLVPAGGGGGQIAPPSVPGGLMPVEGVPGPFSAPEAQPGPFSAPQQAPTQMAPAPQQGQAMAMPQFSNPIPGTTGAAQNLAAPFVAGWKIAAPVVGKGAQNISALAGPAANVVESGARNLASPGPISAPGWVSAISDNIDKTEKLGLRITEGLLRGFLRKSAPPKSEIQKSTDELLTAAKDLGLDMVRYDSDTQRFRTPKGPMTREQFIDYLFNLAK